MMHHLTTLIKQQPRTIAHICRRTACNSLSHDKYMCLAGNP